MFSWVHAEIDSETGCERNLGGKDGGEETTGSKWGDERGKGKQPLKASDHHGQLKLSPPGKGKPFLGAGKVLAP